MGLHAAVARARAFSVRAARPPQSSGGDSSERKGPKKTVREIHIQFPTRKVGAIIGKAGVNIKIIEAKSNAKLNIHKPKVEPGEPLPDETLVTIKGRPEAVDKACETVNMVLAQFAAHRAAQRAKK